MNVNVLWTSVSCLYIKEKNLDKSEISENVIYQRRKDFSVCLIRLSRSYAG